MISRFLLTLLFTGVVHYLYAQDFSNKGKDFWLAYPSHIDGTASVMGIYITSDVNTSGTIQVGPSATISFTVSANQVTRKFIGNSASNDASNSYVLITQQDGVKTNAAIHITSDRPVVVYTHIIRSARSGACLALPTPVLGLEYIAPSNSSVGGNPGSDAQGIGEITVVATQSNTVIEVTPTLNGRAGRLANTPFQVTLPAAGDVYQWQGLQNGDISGTRIKSISTGTEACKPIAVFSASTWSAFDCTSASGGDNLYQQLFPLRSWGKRFITAPFINRPYDLYRIFVDNPLTKVTVVNNGITSLLTASSYNAAGGFYSIKTTNPLYVEGDQPISVVQYIVAQNCKTGCTTNTTNPDCYADPEMVLLNPIEQTLGDITFFSAHRNYVPTGQTQVTQHYVNVIIDKRYKNSVQIDNAPPTGFFIDIPGTVYSFLQENVSASSAVNPVHRIKADTSFSAIVYGYGQVESYGYNGGTNIKDLYQFVSLQNQYATINFPATCINTPFKFSITLPYKPTSLSWDFSDNPLLSPNNSVVSNSPVYDSSFTRDNRTLYVYKLPDYYKYKGKGTYPVKVLANNPSSDGCSGLQEINYDVEVFDPPVVTFSVMASGCQPDSVRFTDQSNGNGRPVVKWLWNFGDNTIDTIKNPVKLYAGSKTFNVGLRVITDIGCLADTIKPLVISPRPVAKFGDAGTYCPFSDIVFSDSSTISSGTIVKWTWNFGDGSVIIKTSGEPVTHQFKSWGSPQVSLLVESSTGCISLVYSRLLFIHSQPVLSFDLPGVCLPSGVAKFTNSSYDPEGNAMTYVWNFGDQKTDTAKNPFHTYAVAGPFNVTLQATTIAGCKMDSSKVFSNIFAQPKARFTASKNEVCLGDSINFTDNSTATANTVKEWFWNFGDGTTSNLQHPSKTFAKAGNYEMSLFIKSASGCISDTMKLPVVINALPVPSFTTSTVICEGKAITFTNTSQAGSGIINSYFYNFGDGTTALLSNENPFTKSYELAGSYTIRFAVKTNKGCLADTLTKVIEVNAQPVANFITPYICLNDAFATFTDSSYIKSSSAAFTYSWNFNDPLASGANGNTSTLQNPRHKYGAPGNYNVRLAITSAAGCRDTIVKDFVVNGAVPKSAFEVMNSQFLCSNTVIKIKNTSSVDFGIVTRVVVQWDIQNNPVIADTFLLPKTGDLFTHQYPSIQSTKVYQIKVKAFSGETCLHESVQSVTVNASPLVTISTLASICYDATARQLIIPGNGGVAGTGAWSGAGVAIDGRYTPTLTDTGVHNLKYVYTSGKGCVDSASQTIRVWPSPKAKFAYSSITCVDGAITFTDSSTTAYNKITQWNWNLGNHPDTFINNNRPLNNTYALAANYSIRLQVVTDSGCRSAVTTSLLVVHPKPEIKFLMPFICLPNGMGQFFDNSSIKDGTENQFTYSWMFGDKANAAPATAKNPAHQYSATGPFMVKLMVTSGNNCIDSLAQQISTIYPQPKADFNFTPTDTCLGGTFYFTDKSISRSGSITNWFWNLGDGSTSVIQNPARKYGSAKNFNISLYIKNQQNCNSDTIIKSIVVHSYPVVNAGPDINVLEGGNAIIKATASGNGLQYLWTPDNYLNNNKVLQPVTTPFADITYKLTATGTGGCTLSDEMVVTVLKSVGIPTAFSPNGDGINDTWIIQYMESYPGSTVEVFNRYGQQVFYSSGYSQPWNGTLKGNALPVGVYYYIINPKNGRLPYTGSVTILK